MKRIPRLHLITDETHGGRFDHVTLAELAACGGADAVQLREKRPRTTIELVDLTRQMLEVCRPLDVTLVVDDRVDVARSAGATAVHLGRDDLDAQTSRAILGADAIIGGTANSYDEARSVWATDVDYIGVGPIYGTNSKERPAPTMGLETLAKICRDSPVPVVAIGNIHLDRIAEVVAAGAHGVAILSAIVLATDPSEMTRRCREALDAALGSRA